MQVTVHSNKRACNPAVGGRGEESRFSSAALQNQWRRCRSVLVPANIESHSLLCCVRGNRRVSKLKAPEFCQRIKYASVEEEVR